MPNFIEIDQTSLEIGVGRKKNFHPQTHTHTYTDTRHPDWLSCASQHARGATKNSQQIEPMEFDHEQILKGIFGVA